MDRREDQARALHRLTGCVDEVIALVGDVRTSVHADDEVAAHLRGRSAEALRAVATMLRTVEVGMDHPDEPEARLPESVRAAQAVMQLGEDASDAAARAGQRYLAAASIAVTLHQAVEAWS